MINSPLKSLYNRMWIHHHTRLPAFASTVCRKCHKTWPAFKSKTQNNKLSISINKHGETIKCSILDNGIGRSTLESSMKKKLIYKSMGTQISNQRIELIRSMKLGYI